MAQVAIILGRQGTLEKHDVAICLAFYSYSSFYQPQSPNHSKVLQASYFQ